VAPEIISIYTEISTKGLPFKARSEYKINWAEIIDISQQCGLIEMSEKVFTNMLTRVTYWKYKDSYLRWLQNPLIKIYIKERDQYNQNHNIKTILKIIDIQNED
jgi:hypothetical protein